MDAKVTLSFDKEVIQGAKKFAAEHHISLSRLTEYLYSQIISGDYVHLDQFPVADWVNEIAEGEIKYQKQSPSRKQMKEAFYNDRK